MTLPGNIIPFHNTPTPHNMTPHNEPQHQGVSNASAIAKLKITAHPWHPWTWQHSPGPDIGPGGHSGHANQ